MKTKSDQRPPWQITNQSSNQVELSDEGRDIKLASWMKDRSRYDLLIAAFTATESLVF